MRNLIATSAAILLALPVASQQLPDGTQFSNGPIMTAANGGSQTPSAACSSYNMGAKTTMGGGNSNVFATGYWVASANQSVIGATVRTKAKSAAGGTVTVQIAVTDAAGKPTALNMAKCSIKVTGTTFGNYSGKFAAPIALKSGSRYALVHSGDGQVDHPRNADANAVKVAHYWRPPTGSTWSGPWTSVAWCIQADCSSGGGPSFTSPRGMEKTEGSTVFYHWGSSAGRRMQSIDETSLGKPAPIRKLSFRQNGTAVSAGGGARSMTATLIMGEGSLAVGSCLFAENLDANVKTVIKAQTIKMPDWSQLPKNSPAPFTFHFPFAAPWVYTGKMGLVWDVAYSNPTATGAAQTDREFQSGISWPAGAVVGTGCSGWTYKSMLQNAGPGIPTRAIRLTIEAHTGPVNALVTALIGAKPINMNFGGCAPLYVNPNVSLPIGKNDANGKYSRRYFAVPYNKALEGGAIVTQLAAADARQKPLPVALSNGVAGNIPSSTVTTGVPAAYLWASSPTAIEGIGQYAFYGGTLVAQLSF